MGIEELSHSDKMPMPITAKALPHIRLGMRLLVKRGSDGYPGTRPGAKTVADVAAAPGRNQVPRGIAYMLGSTVMFAGGNAVVEWQLAPYPLGDHIAARRMERLADATLPRASAARAVAVRLDAVLVPRGQRAVARLGDGDRLRGAIVHDPAVDRDPEGEGRHPPLVDANRRVCRRSAHHPSRRRHADLRRAVRAWQRGPNLDRGDRDPPHEHDRVDRDPDALPDEHNDVVHCRPADTRVPRPALARRADGRACRGRQRNRPALVDALAA